MDRLLTTQERFEQEMCITPPLELTDREFSKEITNAVNSGLLAAKDARSMLFERRAKRRETTFGPKQYNASPLFAPKA